MTVRDALNSALDEEMDRDADVFVLGEEVGEYQGAYKITRGLLAKHGPARVLDTPITEAGFAGLTAGAAFAGLRPVCEFMTFNFAMQARRGGGGGGRGGQGGGGPAAGAAARRPDARPHDPLPLPSPQAIDQIINSAAKTHYMSAGAISCPAVFRGPNGAAAGVAAQPTQCYAAWYASVPGLKVLAPYDAEDARGLLKAAIRDPDPVIFLENEILYGESFPVTPAVLDKDFTVPIGKAKVMREGSDVTLLAFGKMVGYCLAAADALAAAGVSAEVVNLRSLRPLDSDTVLASVRKTHRAVTVEEGWPVCGVGAELAALIGEHAFDDLDAPVERVTGVDVPLSYAEALERASLPQVPDVVRVVQRMLGA